MTTRKSLSSSQDRSLGAFIGLAVGDALGAPVEFKPRGTFAHVDEMRAGGYFRLPAGAWTDDTAMALCLADSLLEHPNFDPKDLLDRFCRWMEHGENTSTGRAIGIGQNTMNALGNYFRKGDLLAPSHGRRSDGNGAIMRLAPVACMHWEVPEKARLIAVAQSKTTHCSELSAASCAFLAGVLCGLIAGQHWRVALDGNVRDDMPPEFEMIASGAWKSKIADEISATGYVLNTLEAALWAVETSDSFETALVSVVLCQSVGR
jgi:ADP-ribosylglycohydrolase